MIFGTKRKKQIFFACRLKFSTASLPIPVSIANKFDEINRWKEKKSRNSTFYIWNQMAIGLSSFSCTMTKTEYLLLWGSMQCIRSTIRIYLIFASMFERIYSRDSLDGGVVGDNYFLDRCSSTRREFVTNKMEKS